MKRALITGTSRGIGKAAAEKFLSEGWSVIGTSTSGNSPISQGALKMFPLDLLKPVSIAGFADIILGGNERIDVLVNNAGVSVTGGNQIEVLRKNLEVNLIGLIDLTERLLPAINDGGHIINVSSGLGSLTAAADSYAPAYSISKAALNMYVKKLAVRLSERHIIVSSVDPGWVKTDMGGSGAQRHPSEAADDIYALAIMEPDSGYFWHRGKKRSW